MKKVNKKAGSSLKRANDDSTLRLTASTSNLSFGNQSESHDSVDLRKGWHTMLRECHRADPERTGHVSRNAFISALERGNSNNVSIEYFSLVD